MKTEDRIVKRVARGLIPALWCPFSFRVDPSLNNVKKNLGRSAVLSKSKHLETCCEPFCDGRVLFTTPPSVRFEEPNPYETNT